ncbi:hypothetical protein B0H14DRAFT_3517115 [Mycena olivaceomarginata]|nr:hypothetical protein B0H14DRAFT_3517115 [Mycena olivaceomarginata]
MYTTRTSNTYAPHQPTNQPTCIRIRIAMHTLRCIHHLRLRVGALAYAAAHATQRSRVITTSRGRARPSRPVPFVPSFLPSRRIASHGLGHGHGRSGAARAHASMTSPRLTARTNAPLYFIISISPVFISIPDSFRTVPDASRPARVPASAEALSRLTFFFSRIEALTNACLPRTLNIYRLLLSPFRFSAPPNPNPNPNPMPCYSNCPMLLIIVLLTSSALPFYPLIDTGPNRIYRT